MTDLDYDWGEPDPPTDDADRPVDYDDEEDRAR